MKKIYEDVKIDCVVLTSMDVITFSENQKDDVADDIFTQNNNFGD